MSTIDRSMPTVSMSAMPEIKNEHGTDVDIPSLEPIEVREERSGDILLESLGIESMVKDLPEADQKNLQEAKEYIYDLMKQQGLKNTVGAFNKTLDDVMFEMDLSKNTEPSIVLDRIGGIVKAYKSISFIKDPKERRNIFMQLARQPDSRSMDKLVLQEMEKRTIWR